MTKKNKPTYRTRNWKQYNSSLRNRGSLTVWLSQDVLDQWLHRSPQTRPGAPLRYSDTAIITMLSIKAVFHLPLRQTQGFVCSLFKLMGVELPVADYSRVSRRAPGLEIRLRRDTSKPIADLVIDSTGVKIYGEGEWKVRTHGKDKRREWRKLHIAVDTETWEITAVELTDKGVVDPRVMPRLIEETEGEVGRIYGDGAYDTNQCHKAIYKKGAKPLIPPRKGAVESKYY